MDIASTMSSKGQITLPIEIRRRLGLKEGDQVSFTVEDDLTVLRPARSKENPFARFAGVLPAFKGVDEVNAWVSDLRGDEDFPG